ncbi:hypothetical protein ACFQJC_05840 [Haloferax namakaokahaiae]|uniref:DUF8123 domain-containing protein n=1 Tax=Haloferax namakaokahaiae TaxID=1748331 RepID=A0ABD5ZCV5_9EURY
MERRAVRTNSSELLTLAVGVFLVLVGIASLVGMQWRYSGGGVAVDALQILAAVVTIALGGALAWLGNSGR